MSGERTVTEQEWLACTDPYAMLEWLQHRGKIDRRKLGLFFAACCRRIQPSIALARSQITVDADWDDDTNDPIALTNARFHLFYAIAEAIRSIAEWERAALAPLLRDIIGPLPFRPVSIATSCLTPYVLVIAKGIYKDRAFDRLASLAEALQEAGCKDADILGHLRGPGPHVRGCWAVDLCLSKS
jgi:hypothetical protein